MKAIKSRDDQWGGLAMKFYTTSSVNREGNWYWKGARSDDLVQIQSNLALVRMGTWNLIWFPMAIPRQSFILWLAIRNSLTTGERLLSWGFGGNALCVFCRSCIEGRNHLFFYCSFCRRVWFGNLRRCLIVDLPYKWEDIVERGVKEWKGIGLKADLIKLVLSASVNNLWREIFIFIFLFLFIIIIF
jgi:hypothetical protein